MAKFLLLPCRFTEVNENDAMLEDMGIATKPTLITDYICINLEEIACFNPSTEENEISVTLRSGERFLIMISFTDFLGVIHEHIGQILEMVKR